MKFNKSDLITFLTRSLVYAAFYIILWVAFRGRWDMFVVLTGITGGMVSELIERFIFRGKR